MCMAKQVTWYGLCPDGRVIRWDDGADEIRDKVRPYPIRMAMVSLKRFPPSPCSFPGALMGLSTATTVAAPAIRSILETLARSPKTFSS